MKKPTTTKLWTGMVGLWIAITPKGRNPSLTGGIEPAEVAVTQATQALLLLFFIMAGSGALVVLSMASNAAGREPILPA